MSNSNLLYFICGVGIGAGGMYLCMRDHFRHVVDVEVEEVRKYYDISEEKVSTEEESVSEAAESVNVTESISKVDEKPEAAGDEEPDYNGIIEKLNYNQYSTTSSKLKEKPYIISFEEYNDDIEYDKRILSYFADDETLVDSITDELIDNVGKVVGFDNLEHINDDPDQNLFVRNEKYGCDYQIVLEAGAYSDYIADDF